MGSRVNKLERKAMQYEITPEKKSRRRAIPAKDKRDTERSATRTNTRRAVNNNYIVKTVRSNMATILLVIAIWTSGFLAARGEAFWSLLVLVIGTLVLVGATYIKIVNNIESEE